jgi:hypothetical protein
MGDYLSYVPGFAYSFIVCAGGPSTGASDRASYISTAGVHTAVPSAGAKMMRNYDSSVGQQLVGFVSPFGTTVTAVGGQDSPNVSPSSYLGNNLVTHPIMLASPIGPIGELRGVRYPTQNINSIGNATQLGGTEAGSNLIMLRNVQSYQSTFARFSGGLLVETALPWQ